MYSSAFIDGKIGLCLYIATQELWILPLFLNPQFSPFSVHFMLQSFRSNQLLQDAETNI